MKYPQKEKEVITQEITLTKKQKEVLLEVMKEKQEAQKLAEDVAKREILISSLILDSAGINEDEVASAQLNETQNVLIITKKE